MKMEEQVESGRVDGGKVKGQVHQTAVRAAGRSGQRQEEEEEEETNSSSDNSTVFVPAASRCGADQRRRLRQ